MSKNQKGSLGYQMMKALQSIFHPGASRHNAKRFQRETALITSINTMRCMTADVHQFARVWGYVGLHNFERKHCVQCVQKITSANRLGTDQVW